MNFAKGTGQYQSWKVVETFQIVGRKIWQVESALDVIVYFEFFWNWWRHNKFVTSYRVGAHFSVVHFYFQLEGKERKISWYYKSLHFAMVTLLDASTKNFILLYSRGFRIITFTL